MGAFAIGIVGSIAAYSAVKLMAKTGIDDALEVFAVHGVGGVWGGDRHRNFCRSDNGR
jgi:Amt family ammonium transporter